MVVSLLLAGVISAAAPEPEPLTVTVGGVKREGVVYAPAKPPAEGKAAPLVFCFHGHGGTARHAARSFALQDHWPEAVVVYLQGLPTKGKTDPEGVKAGWQQNAGEYEDRDLKFFDAALTAVKAKHTVDDKRVYSMGHSNGGRFTYVLWAARGDVFAAVGPSSSPGFRADKLKPKPAMHVAGEKDPIVPFVGQKLSMEVVKKVNGCAADGKSLGKYATEYPSKGGTPFVAYVHPGGHEFMKDAVSIMVAFFRRHPAE